MSKYYVQNEFGEVIVQLVPQAYHPLFVWWAVHLIFIIAVSVYQISKTKAEI